MIRKRKSISQISLWVLFVIITIHLLASCRAVDEPPQAVDSNRVEVDETVVHGSVEDVVAILGAF